jgi:uncharacterized protein (TIGR02118 family)
MIRMSIGLTRLSALTQEEFLSHWQVVHAPLVISVSRVLGIRHYTQLIPLNDAEGKSLRSGPEFDGIAQVDFESIEAVTRGHRSEEARGALRQLAFDEATFIDTAKSVRWWSRIVRIL